MNSVDITCKCGKHISQYVKIIDEMSKEIYGEEVSPFNRFEKEGKSLEEVYDAFQFKLCCRVALTGRLTLKDILSD